MNPNKALWEKGDFTPVTRTMRGSGEQTEPDVLIVKQNRSGSDDRTLIGATILRVTVWIRDEHLDPDSLRVGTDITARGPFNASFSLEGVAASVPEPGTQALMLAGLGVFAARKRRRLLSARQFL